MTGLSTTFHLCYTTLPMIQNLNTCYYSRLVNLPIISFIFELSSTYLKLIYYENIFHPPTFSLTHKYIYIIL